MARMVRTNYYYPPEMLAKLKVVAKNLDRDMAWLIREGIKKILAEHEPIETSATNLVAGSQYPSIPPAQPLQLHLNERERQIQLKHKLATLNAGRTTK